MCNHKLCNDFINNKFYPNTGVIIFKKYRLQPSEPKIPLILLGEQKVSVHENMYTIFLDYTDKPKNPCWIDAVKHNLRVVYKIKVDNMETFDKCFKNSSGSYRYILRDDNIIFIGEFEGLSRTHLNERISKTKEGITKSVDWFIVKHNKDIVRQIRGKKCNVSNFAQCVIIDIVGK